MDDQLSRRHPRSQVPGPVKCITYRIYGVCTIWSFRESQESTSIWWRNNLCTAEARNPLRREKSRRHYMHACTLVAYVCMDSTPKLTRAHLNFYGVQHISYFFSIKLLGACAVASQNFCYNFLIGPATAVTWRIKPSSPTSVYKQLSE